ncbi:MAG: hypothetical protein KJ583_02065 [Nanoarchaeota archaeon]|nr:hypothetical protein [Nanoarchaeota archaeon]MBU1269656.1 hypothetical protein [Nanoarchaeota archaeon]MBU1604079.1 hypothetical protein [Nanoarchaeota archaeon]MBU2443656.1 hypothetical protein [Nanoarchaeota archaeon]
MNLFIKCAILASITLILTACTNNYDVKITDVDFEHEGAFDIIKYKATNPSSNNLSCTVKIRTDDQKLFSDSFEIKNYESKNLSHKIKLPAGQTNVMIDTNCKKT